MAVNEVRDFIENGNIKNSVNYPACNLGVCATESRVAVCHKNVPAVISKITSAMGGANVNIESMANASRGEYAYSLLDLDKQPDTSIITELASIEGVIKVRVVK